MQDIVKQIIDKTGIPADKAQQVLGVVANFIKDKFPAMGGQIDSLLGGGGDAPKGDDKAGGDAISDLKGKFGL